MKNKYQKVMENIHVSDAMREDIITSLHEKLETDNAPKKSFFTFKKLSLVAISLVAIISISLFLPKKNNEQPNNNTQVIPDIMAYQSIEELSSALGFEIIRLDDSAFNANEIKYLMYWQKMAQINYINDNNTFVFRQAKGSDDISGDFNQYSDIISVEVKDNTITLKGNEGLYSLAIWQDQDFTYALSSKAPLAEAEWKMLTLSGK